MTHHDRTQIFSLLRKNHYLRKKRYPLISLWVLVICQLCDIFEQLKSPYVSTCLGKTFENYICILITSIQLENIDVFNTGSDVSQGLNLSPTRQRSPPEGEEIKHVPCAGLSDVCYPRHFIGILFDLFNCLPFSCRYVCIYVCIHTCTYICISGKILLTWIFGSGRSDEKLKAIEFFTSYTMWNSLLK